MNNYLNMLPKQAKFDLKCGLLSDSVCHFILVLHLNNNVQTDFGWKN